MPLPFLTPDNQPITWKGFFVYVTIDPRQFYIRSDSGNFLPLPNPPTHWLTVKLQTVTHQLNR